MRDEFAFFIEKLGSVEGKTVVEIGPGDTIALGGLFLDAGADEYIAYDRYFGDVFSDYAIDLYGSLGLDVERLKQQSTIHRISIEDVIPTDEADVVISFDVVEHLVDPHRGLRNMAGMLKPGGTMIHRVDYSAHGVWRDYYSNGLAFLTIPEWLWSLMGSNRGYPNRARHPEILRTLNELSLDVHDEVTRRFRSEDLDSARRHLLPRFRTLTDDELLVSLADVSCRRTAA